MLEYANTLQMLAVEGIKKSFNSEIEIDINNITLGEFIQALDTADANGTREEFEKGLAAQLGPVIDMVMAQKQAPQQAETFAPNAPQGYHAEYQ